MKSVIDHIKFSEWRILVRSTLSKVFNDPARVLSDHWNYIFLYTSLIMIYLKNAFEFKIKVVVPYYASIPIYCIYQMEVMILNTILLLRQRQRLMPLLFHYHLPQEQHQNQYDQMLTSLQLPS